MQRSVSQDASSSSQAEDDLQFSCGYETPSPNSGSNDQLDERFRPRTHQVKNAKDQYEFMRHPTKPRAESAHAAPVGVSNYVHMSPSANSRPMSVITNYASSDYVNHVILKVNQYESTSLASSPPSAKCHIGSLGIISPRMNTHERVVLKKTERKNSVKDSGNLQYSEVD